jgi:hypothetical protein
MCPFSFGEQRHVVEIDERLETGCQFQTMALFLGRKVGIRGRSFVPVWGFCVFSGEELEEGGFGGWTGLRGRGWGGRKSNCVEILLRDGVCLIYRREGWNEEEQEGIVGQGGTAS